MATREAIVSVLFTSFSAMAKISIVSAVGFMCAKYPQNEPLLPLTALKYLSRISNIIFLPSLIVDSLGSSLSFALLQRIGF